MKSSDAPKPKASPQITKENFDPGKHIRILRPIRELPDCISNGDQNNEYPRDEHRKQIEPYRQLVENYKELATDTISKGFYTRRINRSCSRLKSKTAKLKIIRDIHINS